MCKSTRLFNASKNLLANALVEMLVEMMMLASALGDGARVKLN